MRLPTARSDGSVSSPCGRFSAGFIINTAGCSSRYGHGLSWIFNTAMVANRPPESMEIAQKFVNLELDADKQIEFARLTGYPPTNLDAMKNLPPDLAKLRLSEDELALLGKLQRQADYMVQFAYRDQFADRWNKEVLAAK